jgi:hypothetical protein
MGRVRMEASLGVLGHMQLFGHQSLDQHLLAG